ncbi:TPA: ead/Ea22-like family protein [Enterobacter roggenkampii]
MSNIDKRALREAANAANEASWGNWGSYKPHKGARGYEVKVGVKAVAQHCLKVDSVFIAAANPTTVLALLDELEAKDNRINRLEAIVAVAEQRNALMREWKRALKVPCDLVDDQVPVVIHGMVIRLERLKETEAKLEAAEKRTAELEARTLVPVEPTLDQLVAGKRRLTSTGRMSRLMSQRLAEVYRAMVSAAAAGKGEAS